MVEGGSLLNVDESSRFRLAGVDVLRGLSVLLVVLHHIHLRFKFNKYPVDDVLPETLNQVLFWSGYYAVITFFVISGFLITRLSIRRWEALGSIHAGRFYGMRMARILPCLLLILLVLSVLHFLEVQGFVMNPEKASLGRGLFAALTFHMNWLEGQRGWLPGAWDVLWSLSVEEVFYLLFPLVCLAFRKREATPLAAVGPDRSGPDQSHDLCRPATLGQLRLPVLHGWHGLWVHRGGGQRQGKRVRASPARQSRHWSGNGGARPHVVQRE